MYQGKPAYIGSTDKVLRDRILTHLGHIHEYKAAEYRRWAEGKRITVAAFKPKPVTLLGRKCQVHHAIEVALIDEFKPPFVIWC